MLVNKKLVNLSQKFDIFFSYNKSLLFLKGTLGVITIKMPSLLFYYKTQDKLSFIFLKNFFYSSFFSQFISSYKQLFLFNFIKLRIKGLGYRIKKIGSYLFRFFFGSTNFFYFHVPFNVLVKVKKRRLILLSNNLVILKTLLAHLLLLKKLSVYRVRGLVYPRQIITLKIGKKNL